MMNDKKSDNMTPLEFVDKYYASEMLKGYQRKYPQFLPYNEGELPDGKYLVPTVVGFCHGFPFMSLVVSYRGGKLDQIIDWSVVA